MSKKRLDTLFDASCCWWETIKINSLPCDIEPPPKIQKKKKTQNKDWNIKRFLFLFLVLPWRNALKIKIAFFFRPIKWLISFSFSSLCCAYLHFIFLLSFLFNAPSFLWCTACDVLMAVYEHEISFFHAWCFFGELKILRSFFFWINFH